MAAPETVSIGDLAKALGSTRSTVLRAIGRGDLAEADRRTLGGHRRWTVRLAVKVVTNAGGKVPAAWRQA